MLRPKPSEPPCGKLRVAARGCLSCILRGARFLIRSRRFEKVLCPTYTNLSDFETAAIYAVLVIAVISLVYAYLLYRNVMAESKGTEKMIQVWTPVKEGADAYLGQQLRTILPFMAVLVFALFASVWIAQPTAEARAMFGEQNARTTIAIGRAIAFILGASFSLMVGQLGMRMAVQGNIRVAAASMRDFGDALRIAYRSGTVTGMLTDGLGLLGGTTIFIIFGAAAPDALLGFGFGGTLVALFMRVGGGIYTKAADVGRRPRRQGRGKPGRG